MSFYEARLAARGGVPPHKNLPYASGSTFLKGALLVMNGSGEWAECAADPSSVGGIATHDVGTDTLGFGGHGYKEFPPGSALATLVANEVPFFAEYVGTLPAANGGSYGVVKDTDGRWKVDFAETTAVVVKLVGRRTAAPDNLALVEVVFLSSDVQIVA